MLDLSRLLRARSIAVIGGHWAANVCEQLDRIGFDGPVWPVHPTRKTLGGRACLSSIEALPDVPDATFIGVNRHATIECVRTLARAGAGGAICFASGWAESGQTALQDDLVSAAGTMPILGPNCYGLINYLDGVLLWPDQHGGERVKRGVAILSQSSNIAISLTMQRRALPIAFVACLGNAAQLTLAQLAAELLADERVTALGLYIEGIDDAAALAAVSQDAHSRGKGIVALKGGHTALGAAAAATHTAALSGEGVVSSAYLAQAGIAEVRTPDLLIETLKLLHLHGPLRARRFCAVACSGGEAGLVADLADGLLEFPALDTRTRARLEAVLGPHVTPANPLDYQTGIWADEAATARVFIDMLAAHDAGLFVIDPPRADRCDPASFEPALRAIEHAARVTGHLAFAVSSMADSFDEGRAAALLEQGVVPLCGLASAIGAIHAARTPPPRAGWRAHRVSADAPGASRGERVEIRDDEAQAKALLATIGIVVPRAVVAPSPAALAQAAHDLVPPLAMKGLGPIHKSDTGAVRLHLEHLDGQPPMSGVSGYLAEEMVTDGVVELLVGLRRDPCYGTSVTLGIGGTSAELLADTVTLIAPLDADEIEAGLRRLRLWPLLDGYRGRARADVAAAVDAIMRLQGLFDRPDLLEIEINPLIVRRRGAVAVDAIVRRLAQ